MSILDDLTTAYDQAEDTCYGTETPPTAIFDNLEALITNVKVYGFDPLNETLGYQLYGPENGAPTHTLTITTALPRKGRIVDWHCPITEDDGPALHAFLTSCHERALRRAGQVWPLPAPPQDA